MAATFNAWVTVSAPVQIIMTVRVQYPHFRAAAQARTVAHFEHQITIKKQASPRAKPGSISRRQFLHNNPVMDAAPSLA